MAQEVLYSFHLGFGIHCIKYHEKIIGIISVKHSRGDMKHIKYYKRSHLEAEKTCKQSTVYSNDHLYDSKLQRIDSWTVDVNKPGSQWNG